MQGDSVASGCLARKGNQRQGVEKRRGFTGRVSCWTARPRSSHTSKPWMKTAGPLRPYPGLSRPSSRRSSCIQGPRDLPVAITNGMSAATASSIAARVSGCRRCCLSSSVPSTSEKIHLTRRSAVVPCASRNTHTLARAPLRPKGRERCPCREPGEAKKPRAVPHAHEAASSSAKHSSAPSRDAGMVQTSPFSKLSRKNHLEEDKQEESADAGRSGRASTAARRRWRRSTSRTRRSKRPRSQPSSTRKQRR